MKSQNEFSSDIEHKNLTATQDKVVNLRELLLYKLIEERKRELNVDVMFDLKMENR